MPRLPRHPALVLTIEEKEHLDQLRQSRTASVRDVQRAQILWRCHAGETVTQIAGALKTTRNSVVKWIDKTLQTGVVAGMKDTPHKPREAVITDDAKAWVVHPACSKPKDFGYAAELWTRSALAAHVRREAVAEGFPALVHAGKATVQRILAARELQPHKIRYCSERRDPGFETKMREVLLVCKDVAMENEVAAGRGGRPDVVTVSVDEKRVSRPSPIPLRIYRLSLVNIPRSTAIVSTSGMGRWSILAGVDLFDGHVIARVEERHRSIEFVGLLMDLDAYYPPACTIRLILDNHSAHISKETRAFLATRPNRFRYVLTPTQARS
jgi:DDE superfamily endonuclease/Homeodomain-like domain